MLTWVLCRLRRPGLPARCAQPLPGKRPLRRGVCPATCSVPTHIVTLEPARPAQPGTPTHHRQLTSHVLAGLPSPASIRRPAAAIRSPAAGIRRAVVRTAWYHIAHVHATCTPLTTSVQPSVPLTRTASPPTPTALQVCPRPCCFHSCLCTHTTHRRVWLAGPPRALAVWVRPAWIRAAALWDAAGAHCIAASGIRVMPHSRDTLPSLATPRPRSRCARCMYIGTCYSVLMGSRTSRRRSSTKHRSPNILSTISWLIAYLQPPYPQQQPPYGAPQPQYQAPPQQV